MKSLPQESPGNDKKIFEFLKSKEENCMDFKELRANECHVMNKDQEGRSSEGMGRDGWYLRTKS